MRCFDDKMIEKAKSARSAEELLEMVCGTVLTVGNHYPKTVPNILLKKQVGNNERWNVYEKIF